MELLPCALCLSLQIRKRKDPGENPGWKTNSQKSAAHCQHRLTDVEGRHSGKYPLLIWFWLSGSQLLAQDMALGEGRETKEMLSMARADPRFTDSAAGSTKSLHVASAPGTRWTTRAFLSEVSSLISSSSSFQFPSFLSSLRWHPPWWRKMLRTPL